MRGIAMNSRHASFLALALGASLSIGAAVVELDAKACGACVAPPTANTQVSGHRMILSVSPQATTLWDQLEYVGDPSEFAWVLPIHGQVDVGLSSDRLFGQLDALTDPVVIGGTCPSLSCGQFMGTGSAATGMSAGSGVTVITQEVVGPYETVQLAASDPNALNDWLTAHGYVIPADVQNVVTAYANEGFDFLAMRLVPGKDTAAMRPVRVSMPGAGLTLPLRMVAVGTGAITPIKLWVFGEGRYEPTNAPTFLIDRTAVTFDYGTQTSNMSVLRAAGFDASNHLGWLVNSARHYEDYELFSELALYATSFPIDSGYGDDAMGTNALTNFDADKAALVGAIGGGTAGAFVTRLDAELSRPGLAADLMLGASASQTTVSNVFQATNTPTCPPPPDCSGSGPNGSGSGSLSGGFPNGGSGGAGIHLGGGGCAMGGAPSLLGLLPAAAALGAVLARRRRARR